MSNLAITQNTLPDRWSSLDKDLALLKANGQSELDVQRASDGKGFRLFKLGFWEQVKNYLFSSFGQAHQARLKEYASKTGNTIKDSFYQFDASKIKSFYTQGLAKWDFTVFDRSKLDSRIHRIVLKELDQHKNYASSEAASIDKVRMQAELAVRLGIGTQAKFPRCPWLPHFSRSKIKIHRYFQKRKLFYKRLSSN